MQVDKYQVQVEFENRVHGGIPVVDPDAIPEDRLATYQPWLAKQIGDAGYDAEESAESATAIATALAEDDSMPVAAYENQLNGFKRNPEGHPCLERRQIKAMLRESAQRLGYIQRTKGTRQVLQHDLVVRPLDGNGDLLDLGVEVSGIEDRPIHVMTPQGPRSSIASNEYVEGATLSFEVWVLKGGTGDGKLTEERLREMLDYCEVFSGLGANRSAGYGRFSVTRFERVGA